MSKNLDPQHRSVSQTATPPKAVKAPKRKPTAKWSWSDAELASILSVANEFDACLVTGLCVTGHRITAFLSIRVDEVMDERGQVRPFVMVPSSRLKGGKSSGILAPKKPEHFEQVEGRCYCPGCRRYRGELPPIKRRSPEDRTTPTGAWAPYVAQRLDALAKRYGCSRRELFGKGLYLLQSRKTRARKEQPSQPRPISRQQGWLRLLKLQTRAGIDPYLHATHAGRKTSARWMMEKTGRIDVVRDWLAHRSSATTDAYLRSDNRERLQIAEQLSHEHIPVLHVVPLVPSPVVTTPKRRGKRAA